MTEAHRIVTAPFAYFGSKRRVAELVWTGLGDADAYLEPFGGSLAVLLGRPTWHQGTVETVNDLDSAVANFWRATQADPEAVARFADAPIHEVDLLAKQRWIVRTAKSRLKKMIEDPKYYSAKAAGWWVWGLSTWIGSGWCAGKVGDSKLPSMGSGSGVHRQAFYENGQPSVEKLTEYFKVLAARLRRVRIVNGDWQRILTDGALSFGGSVAVVLDPPYAGVSSDKIYSTAPSDDISAAVREWCIEHGEDKRLRIVLCGYSDEHEEKMPKSWIVRRYSAGPSYQSSNSAENEEGNAINRHKERLWFSPGCINAKTSVACAPTKFSLLPND